MGIYFLVSLYHEGSFYFVFYYVEYNHPVIGIYKESFSTCVGEDIEHANKALSQASGGVRGQADVHDFSYFVLFF